MEIGKLNHLKVNRKTDFGYFLIDEAGNEVLLPNAYVPEIIELNQNIEVFVYHDSMGRETATTLKPLVEVDQFALLEVKQMTKMGAFLDIGLAKDILLPFSEQSSQLKNGQKVVVFVFEDEKTERMVASMHVEQFLFHEDITVEVGEKVSIMPYKKTNIGMQVIVNNMFQGMIFNTDLHKSLSYGLVDSAYVKNVREDGKIDLILEVPGYKNSIDHQSQTILDNLESNRGFLPLNDHSDPELIKRTVGLSKKAFKRAIGHLYKERKIRIESEGIYLS
ncbi:MAG TPA: S1-like domain-containing RNA-binding protein [Saprospiraceae bacterium]|nr:S1-like domain-containing RNA-binding protein [Saprospiraceae bacterium]